MEMRIKKMWELFSFDDSVPLKQGWFQKETNMQKQPDAEYMMCVRGSLIRQLEQPEGHRNTKGNLQWAQRLLKTV